MNRSRISALWLVGGYALTTVVVVSAQVYRAVTYIPDPRYQGTPWDDLPGSLMLLPVGMLLSWLLPFGWFYLFGGFVALVTKNPWPLTISAIGCVCLGLYWPRWFAGMMGI